MKYCEEYAALLDLFADGELPPEEMERVRAHLESCPGCRAYVDDALAIRAGFPDAEDTAVPEGFAQGVMDRIRASAARGGKTVELRRRAVRRWIGMAAALAACCALAISLRTAPGGAKGGAAMDASAPIVRGADENTEKGVAPQTAMDGTASQDKEEAAPETSQTTGAAERFMGDQSATKDLAEDDSRFAAAAGGTENVLAAVPESSESKRTAPAPESAPEEGALAAGVPLNALYLTREEAGDLLEDLAPVWESEGERHYELSAQEYQALLTALGRQEELPESVEDGFRVVVTGDF